ncbi:MAG: metalloregulator ArsR/SmtB family transcription factor [Candidatus Marinimicrobia bacterium]|nr:metalloregulator ArsR/SmtB family transcription factor [Candidatus Neomarinimicrobiota bacterium]
MTGRIFVDARRFVVKNPRKRPGGPVSPEENRILTLINIDARRYYVYICRAYSGDQMRNTQYLKIFKALADQTRLNIVSMLSCREMCACELLEKLSISQPTLSHHMKILIASGLIKSRKNATWVYYSIDRATIKKTMNFIDQLTNAKTDHGNQQITKVCSK